MQNNIHLLKNKEWLTTNGNGGYSSSTVCGMNTRKYHGLLVASLNPPVDREVIVSSIQETLSLKNNEQIPVSTNQYPDTFYPQGYQYLNSFENKNIPTFTFKVNEKVSLEKSIISIEQSNTVGVLYKNIGLESFQLIINPLFACRNYHYLNTNLALHQFSLINTEPFISLAVKNKPYSVYRNLNAGQFTSNPCLYNNVEYYQEQERGFDFSEDLYSAGSYAVSLQPNETIHIIFSLDPQMVLEDTNTLIEVAAEQVEQKTTATKNKFLTDLIKSGNQFIVNRESTKHKSIIAGYPWFTDWGRDTMIAMRGITIATGKKEISESILESFFSYLNDGMIPNRFPDTGEEPEYNTADATLWLFIALHDYYEKFKDLKFIQKHLAAMEQIIKSHLNGTRYNIKVNADGMLYAGQEGVQITWMDAKVGDWVVTPRMGYCVELNALWYNALKILNAFSVELKNNSLDVSKQIKLIEKNFKNYFLNDEGYLNDVISENGTADKSIRPNQIYAISLPYTLLNTKQGNLVLEIVKSHLLTDFGLRSLSSSDKNFIPKYSGNLYKRDSAYHQGTVWSFLLPEFSIAWLKQKKNSKKSIAEVQKWILPLENHFYNDNCIHGISEVFDGFEPDDGKGCINQAWSIGMMILLLKKLESLTNA